MEKLTVIWEPGFSGHRLSYVRYLASYADASAIPYVVATTTAARKSSEWIEQGLESHESFCGSNLSEVLQEIDHPSGDIDLIVPDADKQLWAILVNMFRLSKKSTVTLLIMRPYILPTFSSATKGLMKHGLLLAMRLLGQIARVKVRVFGLSNTVKDSSQLAGIFGMTMIFDPCEFQPQLTRDELGIPEDVNKDKIILMIGDLSDRKHISDVIHAGVDDAHENATLALVGRFRPDFDEKLIQLARNCGSIYMRDGYISNVEFDSWINIADAVLVLHRNPEASGVAIKAAKAGTHIIVGGNTATIQAIEYLTTNVTVCGDVSSKSIMMSIDVALGQSAEKMPSRRNLLSPDEWSALLLP
jgi:hypothetical protein